MRKRSKNSKISVHAMAGTEVVLLGLDAKKSATKGLLGFAIDRLDHKTGKTISLRGGRMFEAVDVPKGNADSHEFPIQAFLWGDYAANPGETYTYTVRPVYGKPGKLEERAGVQVKVTTEHSDHGTHGVYFNRGVAGSQAYSRRFEKYRRYYLVDKFGRENWEEFIKPEEVPKNAAWTWLSRGLEKAMLEFIREADGPSYKLRASVYEFTYAPVLEAFAECLERGVDVRIIHHAKHGNEPVFSRGKPVLDEDGRVVKKKVPDAVASAAAKAVRRVGIKDLENTHVWQNDVFIQRTNTTISHNKFIILLRDDRPIKVWTGSTNYTAGGIFGQSNVGHVIRDEDVAARYLAYWEKLRDDPKKSPRRSTPSDDPAKMGIDDWIENQQPDLKGPISEPSITVVFSPRDTTNMLQWYADRMGGAKSSVHFTAAFGVSQQIAKKLNKPGAAPKGKPFQRQILLESRPSLKKSAAGKKKAKEKNKPIPVDFFDYRKMKTNRVAFGDLFDRERKGLKTAPPLEESLTGLNTFVDYLHTKYMLIDPLTENPTVIAGSANFSDASTDANDENMLVIQGDKRVADIYLTEFMRLFNHFEVRNRLNALSDDEFEREFVLPADDSWTKPYYDPKTQEYQGRRLFA